MLKRIVREAAIPSCGADNILRVHANLVLRSGAFYKMQAWHTLSSLGVICIVKLAGYVSIVQDLNRAIVSFFFFSFS